MEIDGRTVGIIDVSCVCGGSADTIKNIAVTSRRELFVLFTCPKCGEEVCWQVKIADLWRCCPSFPMGEQKLLCPPKAYPESEPRSSELTEEDLEFMNGVHFRLEPD